MSDLTGTASAGRRAAPTADSNPEPAAQHPSSVLLVDDEPGRLLAYEAVLSGLGVHSAKAESGAQALQLLEAGPYAAVLLDVRMPDLDGFEVATRLREHPGHRGTPLIFVTAGDPTELELLRGYELGAIDYLTMPVAGEVLRSKVAVLVELHRRRSELEALNRELTTRAALETRHARGVPVQGPGPPSASLCRASLRRRNRRRSHSTDRWRRVASGSSTKTATRRTRWPSC